MAEDTRPDLAAQRAETYASFDDLARDGALPDSADIDYFLVPGSEEADWRPLAQALTEEGYDVAWIDEMDDPEDQPYIVATLTDQPLSASSIWAGEDHATRIAAQHGFAPDGWGFEA
ncbi:ribonuclease E inhibitor RraB [Arenibacterium halophilum]|uniref:Ribonuclease E inhibitor RraB n=1 Tax=Arenibacterium halophilum TaxID=2583821 RepID=A0ABY2X8R1_9RHOB|nr:ribonuclease E inhibitor RraB [Arenibacterium halophilum]TMV11683.1 ribonuclease E inhibitor RraB [Arenibacterium halophilum]